MGSWNCTVCNSASKYHSSLRLCGNHRLRVHNVLPRSVWQLQVLVCDESTRAVFISVGILKDAYSWHRKLTWLLHNDFVFYWAISWMCCRSRIDTLPNLHDTRKEIVRILTVLRAYSSTLAYQARTLHESKNSSHNQSVLVHDVMRTRVQGLYLRSHVLMFALYVFYFRFVHV